MICAFFRDIACRKYLGPLTAIIYGLSPAGLNTVLLIRMYSMTSFFCLAFTYVLFLKLKKESLKKSQASMTCRRVRIISG